MSVAGRDLLSCDSLSESCRLELLGTVPLLLYVAGLLLKEGAWLLAALLPPAWAAEGKSGLLPCCGGIPGGIAPMGPPIIGGLFMPPMGPIGPPMNGPIGPICPIGPIGPIGPIICIMGFPMPHGGCPCGIIPGGMPGGGCGRLGVW